MLVEIKPNLNLLLDLKYATIDNFVKEKLYNEPICYLHSEAKEKLDQALDLAISMGYKMKIFDAYRPYSIQKYIWEKFQDDEFISNPETGSVPHTRGVAVDLTLLDENNKELDMGTAFDEFSKKSHHGNQDISKSAQENRLILRDIMMKSGWDDYKNEWWHYQLFDARDYEIYDKVL